MPNTIEYTHWYRDPQNNPDPRIKSVVKKLQEEVNLLRKKKVIIKYTKKITGDTMRSIKLQLGIPVRHKKGVTKTQSAKDIITFLERWIKENETIKP